MCGDICAALLFDQDYSSERNCVSPPPQMVSMSRHDPNSRLELPTSGLPRLSIDPVALAAAKRITKRNHCACLRRRGGKPDLPATRNGKPLVPKLHTEMQDQDAPGWRRLIDLVRVSEEKQLSVFEPSAHIPWEDWVQVITLPAALGSLSLLKEVRLYGSHLRRLPSEIGRMTNLQDLDIYTSYSLHWLPYEVTRCRQLTQSRMSTRALYGNRNTRLPFPRLNRPVEALLPSTCSICDRPFGEATPQLYWITLPVATDVVPLLVHSCSNDCTLSIPQPPQGYFQRPHKGGDGIGMPNPFDPLKRVFWGGERIMKFVKDPNAGEDRAIWYTVNVDPETGETTYVPDNEA